MVRNKIESKTILVVDDDLNDLRTIKTLLKKAKYNVKIANNGADALDLVETNKPDLILIDVIMPTLSGYDLLRLLKEKLKDETKMAYISIVPKKEVNLNGADGFIQKPFGINDFLQQVKRII